MNEVPIYEDHPKWIKKEDRQYSCRPSAGCTYETAGQDS